MIVSFHYGPAGDYVGEGQHERTDIVKGRRVRFAHFNYEIDHIDGEIDGVLYVTVIDEKTNSGVTPKRQWRRTQGK